jgi:AcrR family transcriptional regulator
MTSRDSAKADRRTAILDSAIKLFGERGYVTTTAADIAYDAGTTKRTMYKYMGSKERILYELQERLMREAESAFSCDPDPIVQLRNFINAYAMLLLSRPEDVRVLFSEMRYLSGSNRADLVRRRAQFERRLVDIVGDCLRSEGLNSRDPTIISYAILGALNGLRNWDASPDIETARSLAGYMVELLVGGISRLSDVPSLLTVGLRLGYEAPLWPSSGPDVRSATAERDDWDSNPVLRRLASSGARLFCAEGFPAATTRELAARADLTKAAVYYYIGSKEELLYRIIQPMLFEGLQAQEVLVTSKREGQELLCELVAVHLDVLGRWVDATSVFSYDLKYLTSDHHGSIVSLVKLYMNRAEMLLSRVCDGLGLDHVNVRFASLVLVGMMNDVHRWWRPDGKLKMHTVSTEFNRMFLHGLSGSVGCHDR